MTRTMKPLTTLLLAFTFTTSIGTTSTVVLAQDPQAEDKAAADKAAARSQGLVSKIWWNQPKKVEELGLSETQRAKMDAALVAYFEGRKGSPKEQQEAFGALGEALVLGDREAARRQGDVAVEAMSYPVHQQIDMMIEVVAVMTPEQRQKLVSLYPKMLSRLWIRSANPRGGMVGRVRRGG